MTGVRPSCPVQAGASSSGTGGSPSGQPDTRKAETSGAKFPSQHNALVNVTVSLSYAILPIF